MATVIDDSTQSEMSMSGSVDAAGRPHQNQELEGQSGPLEYVLLVALAGFACGAIVGYKVPVSCREFGDTTRSDHDASVAGFSGPGQCLLRERCRRQGSEARNERPTPKVIDGGRTISELSRAIG
jgi:hypothetical protein